MDIGHFPTLTCWKWPGTKSAQSHKMTPQERQYKISLTANTKSVLKTDTVLQTSPDLHRGLGIDHAHRNPSLGRQLALARARGARRSEQTLGNFFGLVKH